MTNLKEQIEILETRLKDLKEREKKDRHEAWQNTLNIITDGLSYEEMCELRTILNDIIRKKYASDAIDDE